MLRRLDDRLPSRFRRHELDSHHLGHQGVQLSAEGDAGVRLGHQQVPAQMGHVLRLFRQRPARGKVHIAGLPALHGYGRHRHGGEGGLGGGKMELDAVLL